MSMFHVPAQMMVKNVVIYLINPFVFVKLELYKPFFLSILFQNIETYSLESND